jgi:transcriptional regulator GlxA family with amidase domain
MGVSPYRWFLNARVKHAQTLLLNGTLPLAEIAVRLGFADQSHFTKAFRRATGTTPGEWRRGHRS